MSSRGRKTQPNRQSFHSSLGGSGRNFASFSRRNPEIEELKQDISDLKKITHENNYVLLQSKVDKLERENKLLRYNNNELSKQVQTDDYDYYDNYSEESSRQQMRNKPSDEERAKVLLKTLLKTFPELELKEDETFRSEANVEICRKLIPKLLKEMKAYSPTYEQVDSWLQSIHRSKRNAYLKSNQFGLSSQTFFGFAGPERSDQSAPKQETRRKRKTNNNFDEVEEGAKDLMKALLKTYSYEFTLRIEDTFRSQVNINICEKLIPKLQDDVSPAYNLSYDQVESWLQTFHRNKRNGYLKSDFMNVLEGIFQIRDIRNKGYDCRTNFQIGNALYGHSSDDQHNGEFYKGLLGGQ